jgi:hypothetical protein
MIEFDFDRSSMDEMEKAHVPNPGTQEVASKTGENNNGKGISKTSTCLSQELKKLKWNQMTKVTKLADDLKEQGKI